MRCKRCGNNMSLNEDSDYHCICGNIVYQNSIGINGRKCKRCGSGHVVKDGKHRGFQWYLCRDCGYHYSNPYSIHKMRAPKIVVEFALALMRRGYQSPAISKHIQRVYEYEVSERSVRRWRSLMDVL